MTILFDAVVFDLDGTLVATDRFWVQAARTGARRAFRALGLQRAIPDAEDWMELVGKPLGAGFRELFPDLGDRERKALQAACVEEEHRLLEAGAGTLMPGATELLSELRARKISIGVASNCSQSYLDHMLHGQGLAPYVDEALCLDSPGIANKTQMIRACLERFATRSALMVGDRAGDRDAAWANGIPHVHCAFGFAGRRESIEAQGVIEDLPELLELLQRRAAWIESALERAGALRPSFLFPSERPGGLPRVLGITGAPLSGKGLFARDAARVLATHGAPVRVVGLDAYRRESCETAETTAALLSAPLETLYDVERILQEVLKPQSLESAPDEGILVLEGPFLSDPRLSPRLGRCIHLSLDEDAILLRAAARDGAHPESLATLRSSLLPVWRAFSERYPAPGRVDVVLDASNPLGLAAATPGVELS